MRLEQHSSAELGRNSNEAALGAGQNTSSYETGRMVKGVSEDNCDVLNDEVILHMANIHQEQPSIRNMPVVSSNRVHSTHSCAANKCRIFKPFVLFIR